MYNVPCICTCNMTKDMYHCSQHSRVRKTKIFFITLQQDVTLGLPDFVGSDIKACNPSIPSLSTASLKWENFKFERAALEAIALETALALMASENVSNFFSFKLKVTTI